MCVCMYTYPTHTHIRMKTNVFHTHCLHCGRFLVILFMDLMLKRDIFSVIQLVAY